MGQWVNFFSKFKLINVGVVKTCLKRHKVKKIKPETKWSNYEQTEIKRVELVYVAIY